MDREKVISTFEKIISVCKEDGCDFVDLTFEDAEQILAMLKEQEHKDRMFHALEDDWKRLKELLKEQDNCENCAMVIEDRQPVVRCKDCKHGKIHGIDVECVAHEEVSYDPEPWHPLDWFCADGERKDTK